VKKGATEVTNVATANGSIGAASRYVQDHLLWFVVGSYALAAVSPRPGLWLRDVSFGDVAVAGESARLSLSALLLASLLLIAGLGARFEQVRGVARHPLPLAVGLAGNIVVPIVFVLVVAPLLRIWPDRGEAQNLILGLAFIAAMPIAGSSTAWAQNTSGNLALSLGLVLGSTFMSPLTSPLVLRTVGALAADGETERLSQAAGAGTSLFLALFVAIPSFMGVLLRPTLGTARVEAAKQPLALASAAVLLLLCYSNCSVALPEAVAYPDADYLGLSLVVCLSLCSSAFIVGWWLAIWLRADRAEQTSLMFALGMSNNGTGIVLAATIFADRSQVMLPIIFYNLVQHLIAGVVNHARRPRDHNTASRPIGMED
jgi:BASS family bile acid:Na+ symporter